MCAPIVSDLYDVIFSLIPQRKLKIIKKLTLKIESHHVDSKNYKIQ